MAAAVPEPINNTPATADSKDNIGAPPVVGNAVVSVPESSVALTVAVAVGLATTSSPVGLSSKPRTPPRSSSLSL
jgi:hypothetical protein